MLNLLLIGMYSQVQFIEHLTSDPESDNIELPQPVPPDTESGAEKLTFGN